MTTRKKCMIVLAIIAIIWGVYCGLKTRAVTKFLAPEASVTWLAMTVLILFWSSGRLLKSNNQQ